MPRLHTAAAVRLLTIAALGLCSSMPGIASRSGQTPSKVTPADAAPFLGEWTIATSSQMGPATYVVSIVSAG
ncbi:MAG TPA: hypothetical protein VL371_18275, partial [Gemmataceae bacterium]|nr:hypothetical protein [Gemmataceae bacterium]